MWNKLKDVDHFIRTALLLVAVAGAGYGGWLIYATYNAADISKNELRDVRGQLEEKNQLLASTSRKLTAAEQKVGRLETDNQQLQADKTQLQADKAALEAKNEELAADNERLQTAMQLLKVDQRLVHVIVREVMQDPETGETVSLVDFIEVNHEGERIAEPQQLKLVGDEVRIDCWVVNFEDEYVEQGDVERGTALVFFKRIYGNVEGPMKGHDLDEVGARPQIYGSGGQMTDFQKNIWNEFWTFASDADKAEAMGIRAATGRSVFFPAVEGKLYKVSLRASDGLSVEPAIDVP